MDFRMDGVTFNIKVAQSMKEKDFVELKEHAHLFKYLSSGDRKKALSQAWKEMNKKQEASGEAATADPGPGSEQN